MSSVIGEFQVENSRSRSGKHVLYSNVYVYSRARGGFQPPDNYIVSSTDSKPVYVRGRARRISLKVEKGDFILYVWMVRNFKGSVKGFLLLFNHNGSIVFKAKYINGSLRRSFGEPVYAWIIRLFVNQFKIPVRETRLGDENA
ncbi:hypothetical protein ACSU1N_00765 [Thermogladius sp. 4427co]|uniref:hypothetical protein n=1 Tax=Thermogladius sp. 4427co TaxID=3450718 RepID=UPI003F79BA98